MASLKVIVMEWNDLKVILAIGRAGTLSGAAKSLGMNHSTVFRRINVIEEKMEVRFFDRLPQGYSMTEAGEAALGTAERIDNEVNGLSRELVGKDLRLQGSIRVTAPEGVSLRLLRPVFAAFLHEHTDIQIDLVVTGSALKLSRREADLAIRVTSNPPDTSIGRQVCKFGFGVYVSKEYLEVKKNRLPEEHAWVLLEDASSWFKPAVWKKIFNPNSKVVFRSDSTSAIVNAALDGLGVTPLPCFIGDSEKELVRLDEFQKEIAKENALDLWILMHPDLRHTARVKALMRFIYESLEKEKSLIEGNLQ